MFNGPNALLLFFSLAKSQSLLVCCSSHKLDHVSLLKVAESVLLLRGGFYFIYGKCFTPFNLHCCFCLYFYLEGPLIVNQIRSQASTEDLQELGSVLIWHWCRHQLPFFFFFFPPSTSSSREYYWVGLGDRHREMSMPLNNQCIWILAWPLIPQINIHFHHILVTIYFCWAQEGPITPNSES